MRGRLAVVLAAVAGVIIGAVVMLSLPVSTAEPPAGPSTTLPVVAAPAIPAQKPTEGVLLAWSPGALSGGEASAAAAAHGVTAVTVVRAAGIELTHSTDADGQVVDHLSSGMVIPLDAMAFDPATYSAFVPTSQRSAFVGLGPGEVLLGATSAAVRRLAPGATLGLAGGLEVRVAAVVDDSAVGAAEVAFTYEGGAAAGVTTDRWMLMQYGQGRGAVEEAVRAVVPDGVPIRFRGPGETPWLRAGDAVLPQVFVKEQFGEFAYRPAGSGDAFDQDVTWQAEQLVTSELPALGAVRCHRAVIDALAGAMEELQAAGLSHLVAPGGFDGCHNARFTRSGSGPSRHAWGIAVDLNYGDNPTGVDSGQDPRLVAIMDRWGFAWGGLWLVPDPAHFEFVRPPDRGQVGNGPAAPLAPTVRSTLSCPSGTSVYNLALCSRGPVRPPAPS